jgi:hypothetical protein
MDGGGQAWSEVRRRFVMSERGIPADMIPTVSSRGACPGGKQAGWSSRSALENTLSAAVKGIAVHFLE